MQTISGWLSKVWKSQGIKFESGKICKSHGISLKKPKIFFCVFLLLETVLFQIKTFIRHIQILKLLRKNVREFLKILSGKPGKVRENIPPKLDNHDHFHWQIYDGTNHLTGRQNLMTSFLLQKCWDCLIYDVFDISLRRTTNDMV